MRPYFEQVASFDVATLSAVFLVFGLANFVGTSASSLALARDLKATLAITPLVLALCALGLVALGSQPGLVFALTAVWGFAFGMVPVGWSTWVTRNLSDQAESAGGLQVAVIQTANTVGAALGGVVFDATGPHGPIVTAGMLLAATAALVAAGVDNRAYIAAAVHLGIPIRRETWDSPNRMVGVSLRSLDCLDPDPPELPWVRGPVPGRDLASTAEWMEIFPRLTAKRSVDAAVT